jgi:hypothetical protein
MLAERTGAEFILAAAEFEPAYMSLYRSNLDEDPGETRNLRRQQANLVDELLTDLHRWRDTQGKE